MLALTALVVMGVASIADVPSPRPTGWVSDEAHVLDTAAQRQINGVAEQLHVSRGVELAVVTVDDVPGTPKQFASALFKAWRIGSAQTNNGVLVLLVVDRRRLEIETGTGIEAALTAEWLASMQADAMVPRFKAGDLAGGLIGGVRAIEEHLRSAPAESTSVAPAGEYRSDDGVAVGTEGSTDLQLRDESGGDPRWGFLMGAGVGVLGLGIWWSIGRFRRRGTCATCVPPLRMIELDEVADDAHLEPGQQVEESVGSVDYGVLLCPRCHATRVRRKVQWWASWSGYQPCPSCSYKTSRTTQNTLRESTSYAPGEIEVNTTCAHCGHADSYRYEIPKMVDFPSSSRSGSSSDSGSFSFSSSDTSSSSSESSSSDDSSSSSGFSGGDSHGGGAGSSW